MHKIMHICFIRIGKFLDLQVHLHLNMFLKLAVLALVAAALGCQDATTLIKNAEGFRACTYVDTTGHKTICYGIYPRFTSHCLRLLFSAIYTSRDDDGSLLPFPLQMQ